jgi:hypothetical protein
MYNPLTTQPYIVDDFSGGITDNYLDCAKNQFQTGDNLVLTDNHKLITRGGSEIADLTNYLPGYLAANARTGLLFVFEEFLFENQGRNLYYNDSGYNTITGPTGNPALSSASATTKSAWAYWNHHILLTNDAFVKPQKLYLDGSSTFQIRTAGLPKLATNPIGTGSNAKVFAFANDLKSKFNAHLADTAQHTTSADSTNTITSANATNLATLITLVTEMISDYTAHEADSQLNSGWAYHKAKATASRALASAVVPTTLTECMTRLIDIKSKLNAHDNDATAHNVGASHQVSLADPVSRNYIYAFLYSYEYTVGTAVFKDFGATTLIQITDVDMPSDNAVAFTGIPVIANGVTDNYATTVIKVEIYRTIDSGQTLFYVGEVTNGTTTFNDTVSDDNLQDNVVIYTDGDVVDNDPPPLAKYLVVANDICWYLHVKEGTEVKTNRVRQSLQSDIDSCPETFYTDLEDEITGGANIGEFPIVFCKERIYRLEGFFDLLGRGGIVKREISRTAGLVSHLGIVVTLDGIFFPGNDGFYFTNGYQVQKISPEINTTYLTLVQTDTQKKNIYGEFDANSQRIYWAVQRDQSSGDNDAFFVADIKEGVKPNTPFTTASGGDSFAPTALTFYQKYLYRADTRGYLFRHDEEIKTDPKVDVLASPDEWLTNTIIYDFKSHATHFGMVNIRKWVPSLVAHFKNVSNVSIGIKSYNDDSTFAAELKEVRLLSNILWGDSKVTWGDDSIVWNYSNLIKAFRRFPARGLRCDYKQVQFSNSFTIVENSDSLGTADVDATAKTVTLNTAPDNIWPTDSVDYYIYFLVDNYSLGYLVTSRTDDVLTYVDLFNTSQNATGTKWLLKGYRKADVMNLLNYSIDVAALSSTQDPFRKSNVGSNA